MARICSISDGKCVVVDALIAHHCAVWPGCSSKVLLLPFAALGCRASLATNDHCYLRRNTSRERSHGEISSWMRTIDDGSTTLFSLLRPLVDSQREKTCAHGSTRSPGVHGYVASAAADYCKGHLCRRGHKRSGKNLGHVNGPLEGQVATASRTGSRC